MKLIDLVQVSAAVAHTSGRLDKIAKLAAHLEQLSDAEVPVAIGFLTGWPRQGRLGIGWATVSSLRERPAAAEPSLELADVDAAFQALQSISGKRSSAEKQRVLGELFDRATADEQKFLSGLIIGEVRHGALEGVLIEAVARAARVNSDALRRAVMLAGDLGVVAQSLRGEGESALARFQVELFRPVQPMLADSATTVEEAFASGDEMAIEWKLDGARIQVHRRDDRVAVYTRNLNDVTSAVPEVCELALTLPAREFILDGEVIALDAEQRPRAFQTTMRRFGRKLDVEALRADLPLTPFFFDILWTEGDAVMDLPLSERLTRLDTVVPLAARVPRLSTSEIARAKQFEGDALVRGHEGVMVKSLASPYAAGRRGSAWLKVKTARTLDLVVLAAEWGSGRRQGWLSNLHLGARDPGGGFVMLGKTFKGMTDEVLEWQTRELLAREVRREDHIVHVRPELVVEIAFNEVQHSRYPGGVALRFARVKGYRPDKRAAEADTIEAVRAYLPK
ncbi:MAG: ATP-dependent DNA ligase [Gemmatimonadaceae bacterium]